MDPATGKNPEGMEAQLSCSIGNASTLLDMAGMQWSNVTQGRGFVNDMAHLPALQQAWKAKTSAPLHPVLYGVGGNAHVYVEFIAKS
jgi:2-iminobutanoate/2-iminopropanoate deaminase